MRHRVKFYADEHIASAVVRSLRRRGADVLTSDEAGMRRADDDQHLALAHSQGRTVITQDKDFLILHARGVKHSGIAYSHKQTPARRIIRGVNLIFDVLEAEDMVGRVEYL